MRESSRIPLFVGWMDYIEAWLDGSVRNVTGEIERAGLGALKDRDDPEAIFRKAGCPATSASTRAGSPISTRVAKGYFVAPTLTRWPQFDRLRGEPRFQALLASAEPAAPSPWLRFARGGERLLGAAAGHRRHEDVRPGRVPRRDRAATPGWFATTACGGGADDRTR
jgi:hypothetical protein